jgi:hypothetical protein
VKHGPPVRVRRPANEAFHCFVSRDLCTIVLYLYDILPALLNLFALAQDAVKAPPRLAVHPGPRVSGAAIKLGLQYTSLYRPEPATNQHRPVGTSIM